jgi:hypothetical protein
MPMKSCQTQKKGNCMTTTVNRGSRMAALLAEEDLVDCSICSQEEAENLQAPERASLN